MWDNRSMLRLLAVPRQLLEEPQLGWGVPSWDDAWDGGQSPRLPPAPFPVLPLQVNAFLRMNYLLGWDFVGKPM